jgi:ubiquinone/menaquinone biosynthesis C-methylase UbiE
VRSTREWRVRAEQDPWYAAAAHPGKEDRAWQADEFYALGRSNWEDFERHWRQYEPDLGGTVLEIGCGPGRVTKTLMERFDRVIALDVSARMIQLARKVAEAEYHVVDDTRMPVADRSVDAIFTCHVLQHFESKDQVKESLNESHRVLREGGTIMVHLLLKGADDQHERSSLATLKTALGLRLWRGRGYTLIRRYHGDEVRAMLEAAGFRDVEMREFRVRPNGGPHVFWLGRR